MTVDSNENLFVFSQSQLLKIDKNLQVSEIKTKSGPDFKTEFTQCFLEQYSSEIYIINGDSKHENSIFIYSTAKETWDSKKISGPVDTKNMKLILDHDTKVFYGLYEGSMYFMRTEGEDSFIWEVQNASGYPKNYSPVVGFSQNHLIFLNDPALKPGEAHFFVIHYAYFQPEITVFNGPKFPQTGGHTASFLKLDNTVPLLFAFVPNDFSGTFIVNADISVNTTKMFDPPTVKDANSIYAANSFKLFQLSTIENHIQMWSLDISKDGNSWINLSLPLKFNDKSGHNNQEYKPESQHGSKPESQNGSKPESQHESGAYCKKLKIFLFFFIFVL
jgi:hypothetical protein